VKEHTFETKQFEAVEAAVPASTTLIDLTTKEHTVNIPAIKYVQPVVNYKPVTYTAQRFVPYAGLPLHTGLPLTYNAGLPLTYNAGHPLTYSAGLPLHSGFAYAGYNPFAPLINIAEEAEEESDEATRRKRDADISVPLPYLHAIPTVKEHTFETKQFEAVEAAVPASTTLIDLTTKEHTVNIPAIKYVQPVVNYKPVTYTAQRFVPYAGLPLHTGLPLTYNAGLPLTYNAGHPLTYSAGLPLHSGLAYAGYNPFAPLVNIAEEAEEESDEATRRKRDLTVQLPYLHAVPTTKTVTFETKGLEATDDATPADTTLLELTTKEHEVVVPAVKYVQPVLSYKPVTYTHHSIVPHAGLPLTYSTAGLPLTYSAGLPLTYSAGLPLHSGLPLGYSAVHPFGLNPYAPLVNIDSAAAAEE